MLLPMVLRIFSILFLSGALIAAAQPAQSVPAAHTSPAVTFECGEKSESFLDKANRLVLAELALQPVEANQIGLARISGKIIG